MSSPDPHTGGIIRLPPRCAAHRRPGARCRCSAVGLFWAVRLAFSAAEVTVITDEVPHAGSLNMTHLFGDGMVLDFRDPAVHGRAAPGAAIAVAFNGATARVTAGPDGAWRATLGAGACADMPRSAVLTVTEGGSGGSATAKNVACGQLFVCTGQSSKLSQTPARARRHPSGKAV